MQVGRYKDLRGRWAPAAGTTATRRAHWGGRGELNALLPRGGLLTAFLGAGREIFDPDNLLRRASQLLDSRRHSVSAGAEIEIPLMRELVRLTGGTQLEIIDDTFYDEKTITADEFVPSRGNVERLRGFRIGGQMHLTDEWTLKGHSGRYQRAPSFYELFGDRGAVTGNTDLASEEGHNWDVGLVYRGPDRSTGVLAAEVVHYRNVVDDLIRFIQNSQRVSRPHNIGQGRTHGVELRVQARWSRVVQVGGSYVYQHAENRFPYLYERGNDLPNSPRHTLNGRLSLSRGQVSARYELSRESRHFLREYGVSGTRGGGVAEVNLLSVHSDAGVHYHDGRVYVVNRLGQDNILVLDVDDLQSPVAQFSVGNGTNPQDIEIVNPGKAYVSRYKSTDLLIVDPQSGAELGTIDLSGFADADGLPEMSAMVTVGSRVYVAVQRLDRDGDWGPVDVSYLVVIDTSTDEVVDVDPSTEGVQGIALAAPNPGSVIAVGDLIVVGESSSFGDQLGGIDVIDTRTNQSTGLAVQAGPRSRRLA